MFNEKRQNAKKRTYSYVADAVDFRQLSTLIYGCVQGERI